MSTLCACGIDAESPARFRRMADDPDWPMPFVFSRREIEHCRSLRRPDEGLCAAFCCKEAFFKALGASYNYPECQFLLDETGLSSALSVDGTLLREHGLDRVEARIDVCDSEVVVIVELFSRDEVSGSDLGACATQRWSRLAEVVR